MKNDNKLLLEWIEELGSEPSSAVPLLQKIQTHYGFLPRVTLEFLAEKTQCSLGQLFGVATFYSQFRLTPVGRHSIKVCHGTACHVLGADRLNTSVRHSLGLKNEEEDTTENKSYTLSDVACIGCCSMAPVMTINEEIFGDLTGGDASKKLKKHARVNSEKIGEKK